MITLYKHKNNTDIAFQVMKSASHYSPTKMKLRVLWWNIAHKPHFAIRLPTGCAGGLQNIEIPKDKWSDWEKIEIDERKVLQE